jgi:hypothetical protein
MTCYAASVIAWDMGIDPIRRPQPHGACDAPRFSGAHNHRRGDRPPDETGTLMKDLRTPLNRERGLDAASTGTQEFWVQRLTAAANVLLSLFLIASAGHLQGLRPRQLAQLAQVARVGPQQLFSAAVAIDAAYAVLKIGAPV